jgi:GTPase SAR1 family protein
VFDVTSRESFEKLPDWHRGLEETVSAVENRDLRGFVVANKIDMANKKVSSLEGFRFSESIGWPYIETSAKTGLNVEGLFKRVAKTLFTQYPPVRR